MDETQLQYVLTHELTHIRRFDGAIKFLLTAAMCVHWFNPFVWVMVVLSNRDIELSCDEAVARAFGLTAKSAYALVLIGMEEKKSAILPLYNHFSKDAIEERITAIMKMKKTSIYAIEYNGRQFIYYNNLPRNYAYQYEQSKNNIIVIDIGASAGEYVLLSIPLNSKLAISYNSKSVTYTKVTV